MKTPEEKYNNDGFYRQCVDMLENLIGQAKSTPSEVREMAMLACLHYEWKCLPRNVLLSAEDERALEGIRLWRTTPRHLNTEAPKEGLGG